MRHYFSIISIIVICFYSNSLFAVGLGHHEVISAHNQPLNAKIHLISTDGYHENEFLAKLASAKEYEKRGIEYPQILNDIQFKVVKIHNKDLVIQLSSYNSIKEPHLNLLLELTWSKGQLIREFTFLFDVPALNLTSH